MKPEELVAPVLGALPSHIVITPKGTPEDLMVPLREGWRVKALVAVSNVNVGDIGEVRKTGLAEYHLIYWVRQKATRYYRGLDLERMK